MSDEVICPSARTEQCPLFGKQNMAVVCRHNGFHRRNLDCDGPDFGCCPAHCVYPDIVTVEKEKPLP